MADCLWTETPLGMAAAGSGLGRTLDDHEEITDHVFLVIVIYHWTAITNNSPSGITWIRLRYKNVVIVCGGGVAKGSRQQRIFARPPAAAAG